MNPIKAIDNVISVPAQKLSDFIHARKRGADMKIAAELIICGYVTVIFASCIIGFYVFAVIATAILVAYISVGAWRPELQYLRQPETIIAQVFRIFVALFATLMLVRAGIYEDTFVSILATGFLMQTFGDQIMSYRRDRG